MIVYIVMEIGWEYNDEYYFRPECGGGSPKVAYQDIVKATKECGRLNTKERKKAANDRLYIEDWDADEDDRKVIEDFYEVIQMEMRT